MIAKRWEPDESSMKSPVSGAFCATKSRPSAGRDSVAFWSRTGRVLDVWQITLHIAFASSSRLPIAELDARVVLARDNAIERQPVRRASFVPSVGRVGKDIDFVFAIFEHGLTISVDRIPMLH